MKRKKKEILTQTQAEAVLDLLEQFVSLNGLKLLHIFLKMKHNVLRTKLRLTEIGKEYPQQRSERYAFALCTRLALGFHRNER